MPSSPRSRPLPPPRNRLAPSGHPQRPMIPPWMPLVPPVVLPFYPPLFTLTLRVLGALSQVRDLAGNIKEIGLLLKNNGGGFQLIEIISMDQGSSSFSSLVLPGVQLTPPLSSKFFMMLSRDCGRRTNPFLRPSLMPKPGVSLEESQNCWRPHKRTCKKIFSITLRRFRSRSMRSWLKWRTFQGYVAVFLSRHFPQSLASNPFFPVHPRERQVWFGGYGLL